MAETLDASVDSSKDSSRDLLRDGLGKEDESCVHEGLFGFTEELGLRPLVKEAGFGS